jgi:hypothetical protein
MWLAGLGVGEDQQLAADPVAEGILDPCDMRDRGRLVYDV